MAATSIPHVAGRQLFLPADAHRHPDAQAIRRSPTRSRSTTRRPRRWRSSLSSISRCRPPPRIVSRNITWPATGERLVVLRRRRHALDVLAVARGHAPALALGKPMLRLFGQGFEAGYPLMLVLSVGLLARASIGPAERLLNMLGEQRMCALVYACAFATNLVLCFVLVPRFGRQRRGARDRDRHPARDDPAGCREPAPARLPRLRIRPSSRAVAASRLGPFPQQSADHLAGRGHRHLIDERDLARIFVRREPRPHEGLHFGGERIGRRRSPP